MASGQQWNRRGFIGAAGAMGVLLTGCGGGGSDDSTDPLAPGTPGPDAAKVAAMNATADYYATLPHTSLVADTATMLDYLKSNSAFVNPQLTDTGSIAAKFPDGAGYVFVNTLDEANDTAPVPPDDGTLGTHDRALVAQDLPEGPKAILLNGLGVVLGSGSAMGGQFVAGLRAGAHIGVLQTILQSVGYSAAHRAASVANLRSVTATDVFYLIGHGGIGLDAANKPIYVLSTTDSVIGTPDAMLAGDIAANRIGYMTIAANTASGRRAKLAYYFTPTFVSNYMSFNKDSLAFINGCASLPTADAAIPPSAFPDAMFAAQVSTFVGWDDKVNSGDVRDTAEFLIDRLTGANKTQVAGVAKTPPLHPYDIGTTLGELTTTTRSSNGLRFSRSQDTDEPTRAPASLRSMPNTKDSTTFGLLAPAIWTLAVNEPQQRLFVTGEFGNTQGGVTLGGTALEVQAWTASQITCTLPPTGGGDVVVTVGGRRSNARRLTQWILPVHYAGIGTGEDGHVERADFQLRLRADAQPRRGGARDAPDTSVMRNQGALTSQGSTASVSLMGTYTHVESGTGLTYHADWSGGGALTPHEPGFGAAPTAWFSSSVIFDFVAGRGRFRISAVSPSARAWVTPGQDPMEVGWSFSMTNFTATETVITVDPTTLVIAAGGITGQYPGFGASSMPLMATSLSWESASPTPGTEPDPNGVR